MVTVDEYMESDAPYGSPTPADAEEEELVLPPTAEEVAEDVDEDAIQSDADEVAAEAAGATVDDLTPLADAEEPEDEEEPQAEEPQTEEEPESLEAPVESEWVQEDIQKDTLGLSDQDEEDDVELRDLTEWPEDEDEDWDPFKGPEWKDLAHTELDNRVTELEARIKTGDKPKLLSDASADGIIFGILKYPFTTGTTCTVTVADVGGYALDTPVDVTVYVNTQKGSYTTVSGTEVATGTRVCFAMGSSGDFYIIGNPRVEFVDWQIDVSALEIQVKKRDSWGTFVGGTSAWVAVFDLTECPT